MLDFVKGKRKTFETKVKGPDDPVVLYLVSGLANVTGREKLSFTYCSYAASQSGRPNPAPTYLNNDASYALIKAHQDYFEQLKRVFGNPIRESDLAKKNFKVAQLMQELASNEELYRPKRK